MHGKYLFRVLEDREAKESRVSESKEENGDQGDGRKNGSLRS